MMITRLTYLLLALTAILCAQSAPLIDNDQVTVYKTGVTPHGHFDSNAANYNCILIAFDPVEIRFDGSPKPVSLAAGQFQWMPARTGRSGEVISDRPATLVSVVLKKAGDVRISVTGPLDPVRIDPRHYRVELENDQVRVIRAHIGPGESTPTHEHKVPRVIAYLTPMDFRVTSADGMVERPKRQAGEVGLGAPGKHAEQNVGEVPFEVLAIELKTPPKSGAPISPPR